jgi:hypothetical protein
VMDRTCSAICAAGSCAGKCAPGEKQCGPDQTPQSCSPQGEWASDDKACDFVCAGKGECAGECKPGATRCGDAPATLTPFLCDEKGKWVAQTACRNLCSNGSCGGSCMPGKLRCNNGKKELCGPMGTWEAGETCPFVCTGEGQCTGECKPNTRQCAGGDAFQTCGDDGRWQGAQKCDFVCTGKGQCTGECKPNQTKCQGTTQLACDQNGKLNPTNSDACKAALGARCGSNSDCGSGFCIDGACCDSACTGACHACGGGHCKALARGTSSKDCPVQEPCGNDGTCDGNGGCQKFGTGKTCGKAGCQGDSQVAAGKCDGRGGCDQGKVTGCGTFSCDSGGGQCFKRCANSTQCAAPNFCVSGDCTNFRRAGQSCQDSSECNPNENLRCVDVFKSTGTKKECSRCPAECPDPQNFLVCTGGGSCAVGQGGSCVRDAQCAPGLTCFFTGDQSPGVCTS